MGISLANAIKSITDDEHWVQKCLIGGLICFLTVFSHYSKTVYNHIPVFLISVILVIIGVLANFYFAGFGVSTGNKMINSDKGIMAEWTEKNLLVSGFLFSLLSIVYSLILLFIGIGIFLSAGFILAFIGVIGYVILNLIPGVSSTILHHFVVLLICLATVITGLYTFQLVNAMLVSFYKNLEWADMFNIVKHFKIIKNNQHAAWTLIGKMILYILLFILVGLVLAISIVGIVLLPFVYFIAFIICINLLAQYGKSIEIENYS